jgi:plastocyanin
MNKKILCGFFALLLLTVLVSACRVIDASTIPQNPKVEMGSSTFVETSVTIKKGDKLDLVNSSAVEHKMANGSWVNGTAKPATEPGAPTVSADTQAHQTATIGPFTQAGTYKIYCSIHPGMNLTVVVQ